MTEADIKWSAVHRVRLGHVRKLLRDRYGATLPNDDAGAEDLRLLLHVKAHCYRADRRLKALSDEIELSAPWLVNGSAVKLAAEIAKSPIKFKADTLGRMLNLDWTTRERLRLWQIGAVDMPADIRKIRRRQRNAERMEHLRRAAGCKTRDQYLAAALTATAPWKAAGISRRTWERRRAKTAAAEASL